MFEELEYRDGKLYRKGREAGWTQKMSHAKTSYRMLNYKGKRYLSHRVVWYLHHGSWPKEIDHINRDSLDNRIENLREVTHDQNMDNLGLDKKNKTGVRGVYFANGKYRAQKSVKNKTTHIGVFDTLDEAAAARAAFDK